jgi:hypothetical protein
MYSRSTSRTWSPAIPSKLARYAPTGPAPAAVRARLFAVSGTLDIADIRRTEQHLAHNIDVSEAERAAYDAFRRVWQRPTETERAAVLNWAGRIAGAKPGTLRWGQAAS